MISDNPVLREKARAQLKGNWTNPLVVCLLDVVIGSSVGFMIPIIGDIIITGPLMVGVIIFSLKFTGGENPDISVMFEAFNDFGRTVGIFLWERLWVLLWSLLLIVPGIIKSYSYAMAYYIVADDPSVGVREALNISKKMMDGYKGKLFLLHLSFIGWIILSFVTLLIGFLWLVPYIQITMAHFYTELKAETLEKNALIPQV